MTPIITARRNLFQRIEALLRQAIAGELAPTAWQVEQVRRAIDNLEEERFADGERAMSRAERPDLYEPAGYAGASAGHDDQQRLADRLAAVLASVS